ncbi:kinase binding protein CGI-121-domain-containing protein [Pelagophyceae sp. CCMP2097]|nr:kinase binding protein CGI-121-domain-containing protein [Pelagophyceae sp. CCMP2097]
MAVLWESLAVWDARDVRVALFLAVQNGAELHALVLDAGSGLQGRVAFVDAHLVPSRSIVEAAAAHASRKDANRRLRRPAVVKPCDAMRTKDVHTEFVYSLAPSTNVGDSLRALSATATTTALLVVAFDSTPEDFEAMLSRVQGNAAPLSALAFNVDAAAVAQHFGLDPTNVDFSDQAAVESAVLMAIAVKDCS